MVLNMTGHSISTKVFGAKEQLVFAELSQDWNPMHMDAVAARRTQAGAPVVHGIHILLWALDAVAAHLPTTYGVASLKVRLGAMVYVGDTVELFLTVQDDAGCSIEACVDGVIVTRVALKCGPFGPRQSFHCPQLRDRVQSYLKRQLELAIEHIDDHAGRVGFRQLWRARSTILFLQLATS